jgi:hypothetical protein
VVTTVKEARAEYERWGGYVTEGQLRHLLCPWLGPLAECDPCAWAAQKTDAASISLDNAMAAESDERIRRSVAW